jgi:hypothetical protein
VHTRSWRSKPSNVVFVALVAISVVARVFDILEVRLMDRIVTGEGITEAEATAIDNRQAVMGVIQFAAYIAGAIVFIRWLHAAYRNADVVAPGVRRYGHGWAIGSWFVPFLNLWRPKPARSSRSSSCGLRRTGSTGAPRG